ncbi:tail protein [Escherichia phage vB_EcoP_PhAPEC7]|uniref:Putative tail protein n=1 Tax=Escherichia phage vB_EcoP_PhAPEC7 TaxID=1391223 RepID=A0A067ZIT4_9CAUD|nr:tail protein [Escherichia phage vB_EcoP_PhAPEC7]AHV82695.1 putative tail protein [Escherichia phage vB_EcoP_PhAPEC7]
MNAHTPFDANQDWTNPYCQNSSNDPMVDALLGNAYHVVRTVYCNLGNLKLIYDFLNQYGMVLGVQSEAELKALTTKATFARIYDKTPAGDRRVTDYLYVEGDRTGILPDDIAATGSWVKVATSGSSGGGESTSDGGYIPWIYNSGSANGGETTIRIPDETAGAPFMIVNGDWQTEGYDFEYDPVAFEVSFTTPLEPGDFVVVMRTGVPATPDNPNVSDWVTINWLYNQGAAVGGEQVIDIPYTFQSVPAVYKNGLRFYKGLTNNSYTIDSDNNRIILTEPLATNDCLIVQLGGEAKILEIVDHTIQEVARSANVKDSEVILSTDTTQVLNSKKVIFDVVTQRIYGLPILPTNVYINAVSNGQLTYSPGNVNVDLIDIISGNDAINSANASLDAFKASLLSDTGFDLIRYKKAGVIGSAINTLSARYARTLDAVADFGADPTGNVDSYAALQAWADACASVPWATAEIKGIFKTSAPIQFSNLTGLSIYAQCYIYPTYDTGDYIFGIRNAQGVRTYGRLEVSGQSKIGIKSAFKFWSDNSNGFSFCDFYGICASDALTGITLGDIAYPHALISELTFHGGYTVGTPCAIRAIGNQTYINFIGFNAVSGAPGGLSVATQYTLHTKGANVMFIGGELQHNDNISGATILVEPVTDITDGDENNYGNSYGSVGVANCHVETAAQLCMIANLDEVTSTISNRTGVSFTNIRGYHSQNNGGMITVHSSASEYAGKITTKDIQLYCGVVRNQANIVAGANTLVDYDPSGFGWQFVPGLQAVSGGILLFPRRAVYRAYNSNGQAIGTSPGVVNYVTPQTSDDMYRWTSNYSAGRFTVPAGGLRDVEVLANIRVAAGNVQLDVYVDSAVKTLGAPNAISATVRVFLGNLNAGQVIDVRATASADTTANGGDLEGITIFAER